ncbi:MAG: hypothetical protein ACI8YQ_002294 [Polaribacter sp.]|jgi:hypothetical protein
MTNSTINSLSNSIWAILVIVLLSSPSALFAQEASTLLASADLIKKVIEKQTNIPKSLQRKFKRDAARLALRMEAKKEDLRYQSIFIPRENMESIYSVLSNIYLQDETAQSIAKCNVHTFPNPSIDHVVVTFERSIEWAAPLRDGISETDSEEINTLLEEYDLIIEKHVQWNDTEDAITIRSKEPLNMAAIANEFYNVEGVKSIDLGIPNVGGNDINIFRKQDAWEVQYVLRFGSYITGEGKIHIWTYQVSDDQQVKFISETGDPIPEWMRCNFEWEPLVSKG